MSLRRALTRGFAEDDPAMAAAGQGITLEIVRRSEARRGFVLLPRRRVVKRSFAWLTRFRGLVRDFERLPDTREGLNHLAFARLMIAKAIRMFASS